MLYLDHMIQAYISTSFENTSVVQTPVLNSFLVVDTTTYKVVCVK